MAEEISDIVSRLRIDTEEDEVLDVEIINPNPSNKVSLLLMGRLLTERSFNVEAFKRTITTVWAPIHGLVIRALRPNLFAFQFFHWRDMMKVLEGRPWCFDNMLVLLKEADGDEPPDQVTIHQSPFWIRLKNLPFNMRSNEVVRALIGNMGEILDIEDDVLGFGRYRRVKVMLDTNKPLRRFRKIKDRTGVEFQVDFAYERLPFFCLACGIMGHAEKDCQQVLEEDRCEKLGWHLGLKATPRRGRMKEMEEEVKFKNCKKILFAELSNSQKAKGGEGEVSSVTTAPKNNSCMGAPKMLEDGTNLEGVPTSIPTPGTLALAGDLSCTLSTNNGEMGSCNVGGKQKIDEVGYEVPRVHLNPPKELLPSLIVGLQETSIIPNEMGNLSHGCFVFSSEPKPKSKKAHQWKRLARGSMDEKGADQNMDVDMDLVSFAGNKRQCDSSMLVGEENEIVGKRLK